ncbi:hypothetical protein GQ607_008222 [Colletotrichum asianum]|uniref:Uncharacterized protein n=1 Tax=Colletotrichum asianum TaxID=702518 RepID=A0A8H3ZM78_9PEZI|nr:hypothetical protein GQ607_008222 [Colletotrichum asianum]
MDYLSTAYDAAHSSSEKALRKRGRGPVKKQWKEVYMILFPLVPEKLIPSPRYEDSDEEWNKLWLRNLDQVESYVRLEVVRRLEQENLQLPHPLENQVRRQMIDIVNRAQADAFRSYRQPDTLDMQTHRLDTSCQPPDSTSAQQSQTTTDRCDLEAPLAAPALTEMTENAHDRLFMSTIAATIEPLPQASRLLCSFDSTAGHHGGMGRQTEDPSWMDSLSLDVSFVNWETALQGQNME